MSPRPVLGGCGPAGRPVHRSDERQPRNSTAHGRATLGRRAVDRCGQSEVAGAPSVGTAPWGGSREPAPAVAGHPMTTRSAKVRRLLADLSTSDRRGPALHKVRVRLVRTVGRGSRPATPTAGSAATAAGRAGRKPDSWYVGEWTRLATAVTGDKPAEELHEATAPDVRKRAARDRAEAIVARAIEHGEPLDVAAAVSQSLAASRRFGPHETVDRTAVTDVVIAYDENLTTRQPCSSSRSPPPPPVRSACGSSRGACRTPTRTGWRPRSRRCRSRSCPATPSATAAPTDDRGASRRGSRSRRWTACSCRACSRTCRGSSTSMSIRSPSATCASSGQSISVAAPSPPATRTSSRRCAGSRPGVASMSRWPPAFAGGWAMPTASGTRRSTRACS